LLVGGLQIQAQIAKMKMKTKKKMKHRFLFVYRNNYFPNDEEQNELKRKNTK
jgi:hypothetical protein